MLECWDSVSTANADFLTLSATRGFPLAQTWVEDPGGAPARRLTLSSLDIPVGLVDTVRSLGGLILSKLWNQTVPGSPDRNLRDRMKLTDAKLCSSLELEHFQMWAEPWRDRQGTLSTTTCCGFAALLGVGGGT